MTSVDGENFFEIKKVAEGASPLAGETLRQKDVDKYYGVSEYAARHIIEKSLESFPGGEHRR